MNRIIFGIIVLLIIASGLFLVLRNNEASITTVESPGFGGLISPNSFKEKLDSGEYIVLDLRTPEEFAEQKISEDAVLINFYDSDFKEQLNELPKDEKYLIHCKSGNRSGKTVPIMKEFGFEHFYELKGGITAWNMR